jgi:hypothetical protein
MSDKDLQRVTKWASYIGQAVLRRFLPTPRHHITRRMDIAGQRTLCLSMHDDEQSAEVLLGVKVLDHSSELINLYRVIVPVMNLAPQYGLRLRSSAISSLGPSLHHAAGT